MGQLSIGSLAVAAVRVFGNETSGFGLPIDRHGDSECRNGT